MQDNNLRKFFGSLLLILGVVVILFACVAYLRDGKPVLGMSVTHWESVVPFLVGLVFLGFGAGMINRT
jgi:hypothetical protein